MGIWVARRVVFVLFVFIFVGTPTIGYAVVGDCGQPVSQGTSPTATDALFTLQAAVGARACALAVCDVDGNCSVTSTDALKVLSRAVGQTGTFDCSCVVSTTTTTVPPSTTTTTMPPAVRLHLENVTAQSMEVWIDTDLCINTYQFTVSGATVAVAGGGLTQAAGLSINAGPTLVFATPTGIGQEIGAGSNGELIQVLFSNVPPFVCTGLWVIADCDTVVVPATSIYFRRVDGSLCRSDDPSCFLCNF